MFEGLSLFELLAKGGVAVVVLAVFSLVSVAIMCERAWVFRAFKRENSSFFPLLKDALARGGPVAAAGACSTGAAPLARVFLAGYEKRSLGRAEVDGAMELAGRAEVARLERLLGLLGTIGSTAPFVGLFGTVLGIIRAFSDLAIATGATPAAVADGIAEALIATAAGLFVAVPAVIAYNLFVKAVGRHSLAIETMAREFVHPIYSLGKGTAGPAEGEGQGEGQAAAPGAASRPGVL